MGTVTDHSKPKPSPKPGTVKVFKALYNYTAQQDDELSFSEGDLLYISDAGTSSPWWRATCNGVCGLIPSNYVAEQSEAIDFPLHEACKRGNYDFLKQCLENKVSVNGLDKSGSTPLYWASHGGHIECLSSLLMVKNISINTQNKLGDTALHAAAWKGHTEVVRLLLEHGANPTVKNNEKKLAVDLAKNPETAALLQRLNMSSKDIAAESEYVSSGAEDSD